MPRLGFLTCARAGLGPAAIMLVACTAAAATQSPTGSARPAVDSPSARAHGVQLLLQANRADFARHCLDEMEEALRHDLSAQGVAAGGFSTRGGRLSFSVRDPSQAERALRAARAGQTCRDPQNRGGWNARIVQSRIVVRQSAEAIDRAIGHALDAAREIVAHRIDALGVREAIVVRQGADRILVRAPGLRDAANIRALLGRRGRLEFRLVDAGATAEQLYEGRAPAGSQILPRPESGRGARIAVSRESIVTGAMIAGAEEALDRWSGRPVVNVHFTAEGRRRFAEATRENVGRAFAIVLDDVVITAPIVHEPILGDTAQINGGFTVEAANRLAIWIGSGALPIKLDVIEAHAF